MGTALAVVSAEDESVRVSLWVRNPHFAADTAEHRENRRHLAGVKLPDRIEITADITQAMADSDLIILAVPTQFVRSVLQELAPHIPVGIPVVSAVKGMELSTFCRPSQILLQAIGPRDVAVLGGPSHAEEFGRRLPCSVVAASATANWS